MTLGVRVILLLGTLAVGLWILLERTEVTTNLSFFLPASGDPVAAWLLERTQSGPASSVILAKVTGGDSQTRETQTNQWIQSLKAVAGIRTVSSGPDPVWLNQLESALFPYRWVLEDPPDPSSHWSEEAIEKALLARLESLSRPQGRLEERWLTRDPLGLWPHYLEGIRSAANLPTRHGFWVTDSGEGLLVLIDTEAQGFDPERTEALSEALRARFEALCRKPCVLNLTLGGPSILAAEANARVNREAAVFGLGNALLVTLLLWWAYREMRILLLSLVPLGTGLLFAALAVRMADGSIHAITLGFGSTLLGVAADYPNHVFSHLNRRVTLAISVARIWPTLRLGILTNVAGFGMMWFSDFRGLQELGLFAAAGLLAAGLGTRWLIPWLGPSFPKTRGWMAENRLTGWRLPRRLATLFRTAPWLVTGLCGALFLASKAPLFNDDIRALNPLPIERLVQDLSLQQAFGLQDLRWLIVLKTPSLEATLNAAESLRPTLEALQRQGALKGFDLLTDLIPSPDRQAQRKQAFEPFDQFETAFRHTLTHSDFDQAHFKAFLEDLQRLSELPVLTPEHFDGTPLAQKLSLFMGKIGSEVVLIVPLKGVENPELIQTTLEQAPTVAQLMDLGRQLTNSLAASREGAIRSLSLGVITIGVILGIGLGGLKSALAVLMPMILAALSTAWLMATLDQGLTIYHLASLLLVMGLSLDQALFFNRDCAGGEERAKTHQALILCSLSSILAFGGLSLSSVNLLRAIGLTVALGAVLAIGFAAALAKPSTLPR